MAVKWIVILLLALTLAGGGYLFYSKAIDGLQFAIIGVGSMALIFVNLFEVKSIRKKNFEKMIREAEELYNNREPQNALKAFRKALKLIPDSYEVHLGIAQCHRMLMEFEDAIMSYQKAIEVKPEAHHAFFLKGIVEMQMNRPYDSLRSLRSAEELKPDFEDLHYFLGQLFEKTMQFKEAIKYYDKYVNQCTECKMKGAIEQKLLTLKEKMKVYEPKLIDGESTDGDTGELSMDSTGGIAKSQRIDSAVFGDSPADETVDVIPKRAEKELSAKEKALNLIKEQSGESGGWGDMLNRKISGSAADRIENQDN